MNSILQNEKMRVEIQTKTRVLEDSSLYPETSTKNAVKEYYRSSHFFTYTLLSIDKFDNFYFFNTDRGL
jgi:hypothetical protein